MEDIETIAEQLYQDHFQIPETKDFDILSTIRYDPKLSAVPPTTANDIVKENFFLLPEHVSRLQYTVDFFNIDQTETLDMNLETIFQKLKESILSSGVDIHKPLKIRFLVDTSGKATIQLHNTPEIDNLLRGLKSEGDVWDVYVDKKFIVTSPFTSFKTTYRPHYTEARTRCLPGEKPGKEEVLVVNESGKLMEGSITNVAIRREDSWVTPPLRSGCLCGVTRHFLLMKDYITEQEVLVDDVQEGDEILLFNGIMGVVRGRIKSFI